MVNIILISHGEFCEGLLKSLIMVTGDDYGIKTFRVQHICQKHIRSVWYQE